MSINKSEGDFKTTVYGKYFLLDRIAVGGMAEVFKAKTFGVRGFERLLVIKRILPHLSKDEDFVEMFIDEAKISVELSHANIVQVTDLGKIGDNFFIAMEYIDGKDLRAILKKTQTENNPLSIEQAVYILIESCKGLDYAHRKRSSVTNKPLNIIHRDISPQNVMISYEGDIKIVDFGIAKTASKLNQTQAGVLKGKFGYMSPEQAAGLEVDQRTDVFSTGIILFELLTGRRLFLGDTDFETLEKIKEAKVPPPSLFNKSVPKELDRIALKALEKDLDKRYANIKEMQVDLTRFFYSEYPDFTASNLSSFLKKLFKDEIKEDRLKLKKSLSSLPIEGLIDSELASHSDEQLIDSQRKEKTAKTGASTVLSQNERLRELGLVGEDRTIKSKPSRLYEKTVGRIFKSTEEGGMKSWLSQNKYLFLGVIFLLLFLGILYKMVGTGDTPPGPAPTATPTVRSAQTRDFKITSEPSGAKIYINGEYFGETPREVKLPLEEFVNLELKMSGYSVTSKRLFFDQNTEETQNFILDKTAPAVVDVSIKSQPAGAKIYLNGNYTGLSTPTTLKDMRPETEYRIELRLAGYSRATRTFTPNAQSDNSISFDLSKMITTLRVITHPAGAKVSLYGYREKKSPATFRGLQKGKKYRIKIYKNGYETVSERVSLSGFSRTLRYDLKRVSQDYGTVSVNAIPYAEIYLDGKLIGYTPKTQYKVKAGEHTIIFKHPSAPDVTKKITVQKNRDKKVIIKMEVRE